VCARARVHAIVCVRLCVCVCVCVCMRARARLRVFTLACVHVCMCACVRAWVCWFVRALAFVCAHACVHVRVRRSWRCARVCWRASVRVFCLRASLPEFFFCPAAGTVGRGGGDRQEVQGAVPRALRQASAWWLPRDTVDRAFGTGIAIASCCYEHEHRPARSRSREHAGAGHWHGHAAAGTMPSCRARPLDEVVTRYISRKRVTGLKPRTVETETKARG
jgi:hypothetical protein